MEGTDYSSINAQHFCHFSGFPVPNIPTFFPIIPDFGLTQLFFRVSCGKRSPTTI